MLILKAKKRDMLKYNEIMKDEKSYQTKLKSKPIQIKLFTVGNSFDLL